MSVDSNTRPEAATRSAVGRRALTPVIAGMILDAVDFATMGPIGLYGGFIIGGLAGWWLGAEIGLGRRARAVLAAAAVVYTATPFTEMLPLGTIIGLLSRSVRFGPASTTESSPDAELDSDGVERPDLHTLR